MTTKDQAKAVVQITLAIADTIRELKQVPSGHLYAQLMGKLSLEQYEEIIGFLIRSKFVHKEQSHLLRWTGPAKMTVGCNPVNVGQPIAEVA